MQIWSALASSLHLLSLAIGFSGILLRTLAFRGLSQDLENSQWRSLLFWGDNLWGMAALSWIGSGLWRLLGGIEKPTVWYMNHHLFWLKMLVFAIVFLLELAPMIYLIRARIAVSKGDWQPEIADIKRFGQISQIEVFLIIIMVLLASAMARGLAYSLSAT